jgi:hypothetical protein
MRQIPVLLRDPIVTLAISLAAAVAGVLIAWKFLKPKSK